MKTVIKNMNRIMVAKYAIDVADVEVKELHQKMNQCLNKERTMLLQKSIKVALAERGFTELEKTQVKRVKLSALKERQQMSSMAYYEP